MSAAAGDLSDPGAFDECRLMNSLAIAWADVELISLALAWDIVIASNDSMITPVNLLIFIAVNIICSEKFLSNGKNTIFFF